MPAITTESTDVEQRQFSRPLSGIARAFAVLHRFPLAFKGALAIFDQAIFSGTSFLTAVIIGRATSPDQLGTYYLVLSIILIIAGVQEQLVAAPYDVYSKRRQGLELAEYSGSIWTHHLILTSLAVVSLFVAIVAFSVLGQPRIVPGLWALMGTAPLLLVRQGIRRFVFASLELKSAVALDAAVAVLQFGGLLLLSRLGWLSIYSIFAVMGGACGLASAAWYWWSTPSVRFVPERFVPDWRHNWSFSKWALQTYVLGNTAPQLMLWIVIAVAGPTATGVFGACNNLIGVCYVILSGVANVLTPQAAHAFATGGVKDLRRILLIAGAFFAVTMGVPCVFVLATGDWLVVLTFGSQYHGTGAILVALTFSTAMNALSILTGNGLWAIDQPRSNFLADVCCMAVTLISAAFLIHPWAAFGAALATLAGTTAGALVRTFTLVRCLESYRSESPLVVRAALSS